MVLVNYCAIYDACSQPRHRIPNLRVGRSFIQVPSPGGVAQLVERVLYHRTRRAVPERSWVQALLPSTEVEPGFSTFGGMLVPVLQLISPVCKTGTSLKLVHPSHIRKRTLVDPPLPLRAVC
jgi:hypothetical protein